MPREFFMSCLHAGQLRLRSILRIFPDQQSVEEWLDSDAVAPYFEKFSSQYMVGNRNYRDPMLSRVIGKTVHKNGGNIPRFVPEHADRQKWNATDYAARFVTEIISHDIVYKGPFHWGNRDAERAVTQAFEVLWYLTLRWMAMNDFV
ncbi:hypothetical protein GGS26DRAFT_595645 [Hypomontagnella submonticulosa]|nr:hypothetical protein GGS26DRAFT_595645 [Hypomontagnella submonticulosa]